MPATYLRYNPLRLLNSVLFGVSLMVLIALYLAAGSGRQWLRSTGVDQWPVARDWFDKTDLEFFNAWPLKVLMALLIANLVVVTWRKIPLTPPRYGVWCIHAGIITLILGTAAYYGNKLEGRVRIYADPAAGPNTVDHYYDKDERALYVRTGRDVPAAYPLPTLPRFQQYDEAMGNADSLRRRGLWNLRPTLAAADKDGKRVDESLAELVGVHGDLRVDVVGFYPYATVRTDFDRVDPASATSGVELSMGDPQDPQASADWFLVGSDPRFKADRGDAEHLIDSQHVDADPAVAAKLVEAAGELFRLDLTAPGLAGSTTLYVAPGKTYPLGKAGYALQVENYNPAFPTFETHEPVPALTLLVTTPTQKFRKMVLSGRPGESDFKLGGAAGEPPMRMRSPRPLDPAVRVSFTLQDPYSLLPTEHSVKHTLLTPSGSTELIDIEAGFASGAAVHRFPKGTGDIVVSAPAGDMGAPDGASADGGAAAEHPSIHIHVERHDHLRPTDTCVPVPAGRREEGADDEGTFQAATLRVSLGGWSEDVVVPYAPDAGDRLRQDQWRGGYVTVPGSVGPLQFQLGNTRRPLPVRLTLDSFKVIPFAGGTDSPSAFIKDYRSTVTLSGNDDAETTTEVASLNSPIYFDGGRWLFFQASYDPNNPHAWTQLGVGNRPAVRVMEAACGLIVVGLLYAFYLKPVIIRRMKQRALDEAVAAGRLPRPKPVAAADAAAEPAAELVNS